MHRIVAEKKLGRPLEAGETVHHVNEDKQDFSAENLEVLPDQARHARAHFAGRSQKPEHVAKRIAARLATLRRRRDTR